MAEKRSVLDSPPVQSFDKDRAAVKNHMVPGKESAEWYNPPHRQSEEAVKEDCLTVSLCYGVRRGRGRLRLGKSRMLPSGVLL